LKIEVLFFGQLRDITGTAKKKVTISEGVKLSDLMRLLDRRYKTSLSEEIEQTRGLMIMINGRHYSSVGGIDAPLKDKDTVAIMPAVIGG
jgi:MoaD family protein